MEGNKNAIYFSIAAHYLDAFQVELGLLSYFDNDLLFVVKWLQAALSLSCLLWWDQMLICSWVNWREV